jgi:adenosine deaminase
MSLKKVELHVHLEGTISPELAHILAKRNSLPIPKDLIRADGKAYLSNDFLHFLQVYDTLAALIKCPQDYYDITFDYLARNAKEGAIYIEMMYSPDHAEMSSGIPSIEHLNAIQQAVEDAEQKHGIVGRIIVTAVRHFGADSAEKVAQTIEKESVPCVVGFGLGGDEAGFPPKQFAKAFEMAANAGLSCTVHAGEFAGPEGMDEAMRTLPIQRIGHGVRGMESVDTMKAVLDKGITLEVCPTSNVFLGLFPDIASHPFPHIMELGVPVSINSDDPPFMDTCLAKEYQLVQKVFELSDETMNAISMMAVDAAFVDESMKRSLRNRIERNI